CLVFDAAEDAGSAAGKPCGGLEARLNFAWVSVQDSGTKEQNEPRMRPAVPAVPAALPAPQPARASAMITLLSMAFGPLRWAAMRGRRAVRFRGLRDRLGPAGAHARRRADRRRAAGLRPAAPSGAEPRARRQQGRAPGCRVGRADRL